jgi:hypothetical protein
MKPSEAAKLALSTFTEIQQGKVDGVLVEAIEAPDGTVDHWRITIGYSPYKDLLGIPVSGPRLRSIVRLRDDGSFLGMQIREPAA